METVSKFKNCLIALGCTPEITVVYRTITLKVLCGHLPEEQTSWVMSITATV